MPNLSARNPFVPDGTAKNAVIPSDQRERGIYTRRFLTAFGMTLLFVAGIAWADQTAELQHQSRPVFDPDSFKEMPAEADPFFGKLRSERNDFIRKELARRRKFHEKMRMKEMPDEKRQRKFAEFHQKEMGRLQDFIAKQNEKILKHQSRLAKKKKK